MPVATRPDRAKKKKRNDARDDEEELEKKRMRDESSSSSSSSDESGDDSNANDSQEKQLPSLPPIPSAKRKGKTAPKRAAVEIDAVSDDESVDGRSWEELTAGLMEKTEESAVEAATQAQYFNIPKGQLHNAEGVKKAFERDRSEIDAKREAGVVAFASTLDEGSNSTMIVQHWSLFESLFMNEVSKGWAVFKDLNVKPNNSKGNSMRTFLTTFVFKNDEPMNIAGVEERELRQYREQRDIVVSHALKFHFHEVLTSRARRKVFERAIRVGRPSTGLFKNYEDYKKVTLKVLQGWPSWATQGGEELNTAREIARLPIGQRYQRLLGHVQQQQQMAKACTGFTSAVKREVINENKDALKPAVAEANKQNQWNFVMMLNVDRLVTHRTIEIWKREGVIDKEWRMRQTKLRSSTEKLSKTVLRELDIEAGKGAQKVLRANNEGNQRRQKPINSKKAKEGTPTTLVIDQQQQNKNQGGGTSGGYPSGAGGGNDSKVKRRWCHNCDPKGTPEHLWSNHRTRNCPKLKRCPACKFKHTMEWSKCKMNLDNAEKQ